ncbi:hypothetical protein ACIGCZ_00900 [Streptomyces nigra]|uniref:hypothetical protein n=1 Tax=Streptomyces nigra TaxID=1827580 RepID=UPI0037D2BE97
MALTTDETARHLGKLAALVTQRRVTLGLASKEAAAEACGISHMTYRKIEGTRGVPPSVVSAGTYAKLELAFGFRPGSCKAVLDGADSITLEDGTEMIEGGQITRHQIDVDGISEELRREFIDVATVTSPGISLGEADTMSREAVERAVKILQERGVLPKGD